MSEKKHDDPLAHDITTRLSKAQYRPPKKKKKDEPVNLQVVLSWLLVLASVLGILISLLSVLK